MIDSVLEDESVRNRNLILETLESGKPLTMVTYSLSDKGERQLDFIVAVILRKYQRLNLQSAVYSCLKEIIVNATKANAKRVFFEEKGLDINNQEEYRQGMSVLKPVISESWIREYGRKARDRGMNVRIVFYHNQDGLRFEVFNSQNIISIDEIRLREKLQEGMAYDDLVSFYMANADNTEGEGIGLVMNLLLLKGENINPALFRLGNVDGRTMARVEIPFTPDFVSVRGDHPEGFKESPAIDMA